MPNKLKVPVEVSSDPLQKANVKIAVGLMYFSDLDARLRVPNLDPVTREGYQRPPSRTRINQLVNDLEANRADLPTAMLLNLRGAPGAIQDIERKLSKQDGQTYLVLEPDDYLYVVDGQHRGLAVHELMRENPDRWGRQQVPVVIMLGAPELKEMTEFHIVNSTAKSVPTSLAYDLLKRRADSDPSLIDALEEHGQAWKVHAQRLTEELQHRSLIWGGRIQMAAETKGNTVITSSGMINSLQPVLGVHFIAGLPLADQFKVVDAFWGGVRRVLQTPFEKPQEYSLQKSVGVITLHLVLPDALERVRSDGGNGAVVDPAAFADVLREPLEQLEAVNGQGVNVRGEEFWKVGQEGAAGAYSSSAGRRLLAARLRASLPKLRVGA